MSADATTPVEEGAGLTRITISGVLALLDEGKDRKEIAEYYGKTQAEMNREVWNHPKLKGKKAKKQHAPTIMLEDDTEPGAEEVAPEVTPAPDSPAQEEEAPVTEEAPAADAAGTPVGQTWP